MPIRTLIILVLAALMVSGCGRRGGLEEPGVVADEQTEATPAARADGVSSLDPGSPAVDDSPEVESPQRTFFLDFLL